jgi:hypothetical protein
MILAIRMFDFSVAKSTLPNPRVPDFVFWQLIDA